MACTSTGLSRPSSGCIFLIDAGQVVYQVIQCIFSRIAFRVLFFIKQWLMDIGEAATAGQLDGKPEPVELGIAFIHKARLSDGIIIGQHGAQQAIVQHGNRGKNITLWLGLVIAQAQGRPVGAYAAKIAVYRPCTRYSTQRLVLFFQFVRYEQVIAIKDADIVTGDGCSVPSCGLRGCRHSVVGKFP